MAASGGGFGPVGVGAGQANLTLPQGRKVNGGGSRHARQHQGRARGCDGQGVGERSGAAHAVDDQAGASRQLAIVQGQEPVALRTARRSSPGSATEVAPRRVASSF